VQPGHSLHPQIAVETHGLHLRYDSEMDVEGIASVATLTGDATRARMLLALVGGVARPAGELARCANVTRQTASAHLSKLREAKLLTLELQGRHHYYRLAGPQIASAIESLAAVASPPRGTQMAESERARQLGFARTCYNHLAGKLAIDINESFERLGLLVAENLKCYRITEPGCDWFRQFGIDAPKSRAHRPGFARACLDWTERRHHLAGFLGTAFLQRVLELKWLVPMDGTRAVRVTHEGRHQLEHLLGIKIARSCDDSLFMP
jgi:DNA-binding transcriptional ArsR family regulator